MVSCSLITSVLVIGEVAIFDVYGNAIQYSKAVWIDNMDATHGTLRHWAMGLRTGTVDGGIFIHNISVDTRNIATSN